MPEQTPPLQPQQPQVPQVPRKTPQLKKAETPEQIKAHEKRTRRIILGCFSAFGCSFVFVIIVGIGFVAQGGEENPLLRLLGVDAPTFIRTLTAFVHLIFGFLSLAAFLSAIMGVFRLISAKKEDREAKNKGLRLALLGGIGFIIAAFLWITIFLFLNARSGQTNQVRTFDIRAVAGEEVPPLDRLSAPVTLQFDATRLQINVRRYTNPTFVWDFNDGTTATGPLQTHTFKNKGPNQGRFTVGLTITARDRQTNKEVPIVFTRDIIITNMLPDVVFTITPDKGEAPLAIRADASLSADPDGEIIQYEWDFDGNGDFAEGKGKTAEYTYEVSGTYQVALRITDSSNQISERTKEVVVEKTSRPEAVIKIAGSPDPLFAGEKYTFDASDSKSPKGRITQYRWNFGDDTKQEISRTVDHTFARSGTYAVTLTVTDEANQTAEKELSLTIAEVSNAPRPVIQTTPAAEEDEEGNLSVSGRVPFFVTFSAARSTDPDNDIVEFQWDMDGDGLVDERGEQTSFAYQTIGDTKVTLTVLDSRNNQSKKEITVKALGQGIQASLTADPIEGVVPLSVRFDASGSSYPEGNIVNYRWDFGDGSAPVTGTALKEYRYNNIGTFTARVTAVGADGTEAVDTVIVNVRPIELSACFSPSVQEGRAPLTVAFDPACSQGTIARYAWTFGDGQSSNGRKPVHIFEEPGTYQVKLEVADNQNVISSFTKTITVTPRS